MLKEIKNDKLIIASIYKTNGCCMINRYNLFCFFSFITMPSLILFNTRWIIFFLLILTPNSIDGLCKWYGIAPFCFIGNTCPDGCFKIDENTKGDGLTCWFSVKRQCCCPKRTLDALVNKIFSDDKK